MKSLKEVSGTVWVCLKAVIKEKTITEKWTDKNDSNDNYNTITIDDTISTKFQLFEF